MPALTKRGGARLAACFALLLACFCGGAVAAPFAFVIQTDTNRVAVVDLGSRSIVATIPVTSFSFFVGTNPSGSRAYVSGASPISVIDTTGRSIVGSLTTSNTPGPVAVNPAGTRLAVPFGGNPASPLSTVAIYDANSLGFLQNVTVGSGPLGIIFNPAGTRMYTANAGAASVSVVDTATMSVIATIPVQPIPFQMAVNPAGTRLYLSQVGTEQTPGTNVAVIDLSSNSVIAQVRTGTVVTLALNPAGTRLFAAAALAGEVAVIDTATNTVIGRLATGGEPLSVGVTPDGTQVVIVDATNNRLFVYDANTLSQVYSMTVPDSPAALGGNFIVGSASSTPSLPGARSGLWWNPNESGWGIHFTQRGNVIFAAWYTYDGTGAPKWYVASNCAVSGSGCSGSVYQVTGPRFFGVPCNPSAASVTTAGSLTVNFSGNDAGTMSYTVGGQSRTIAIARQVFRASGSTPAVNYTDLWWNASESGWGMAITQQFQTMFLAWFVYNAAGQPVWYVASDCAVSANGNGCSGTLYRTTGPVFGASFDPSRVSVFAVGSATLTFSDANNGTLSYTVDGVSGSKAITRQIF